MEWYFHFRAGNYPASIEAAQKITSEAKELLILRSKLSAGFLSLKAVETETSKLNQSCYLDTNEYNQWYLPLKININLELRNYTETQRYTDLYIDKCSDHSQVITKVSEALYLFSVQSKFVEGLQYLENMYLRFPFLKNIHNYIFLTYYEFLFYEYNNNEEVATAKLMKLKVFADQGPNAADIVDKAYQVRFYTLIEKGQLEEAEAYLKLTSLNQVAYKAFLGHLKQKVTEKTTPVTITTEESDDKAVEDKELDNAIIEANLEIAPVSESNPSSSSSSSSSDVETSSPYEFDQKKFHAYCQHKKDLLAKIKIDNFKSREHNTSWILPDDNKYNSQQEGLYKLDGKEHFYVYIDPKLGASSPDMEAFTVAIKKGAASKQHYSTGVKFLEHKKLIEVKINAGARAWSNKLYVNDEGEYLVIFDGYGNHEAAAKAARGKVQVISG